MEWLLILALVALGCGAGQSPDKPLCVWQVAPQDELKLFVEAAEQELEAATIQLDFEKLHHGRYMGLAKKSPGAVALVDLDRSEALVRTLEIRKRIAEINLKVAQGRIVK